MEKGFNWNKYVKEALDRTEFMAVSTSGGNDSWTCPVQFSYNEKLDLYFKSMPASNHMKNILKNWSVSVAVFSTNRLPKGNVVGIQLKGVAKILRTRRDVTVAAKYHYGRSKPKIDYKTRIDEHIGEDASWNFVKITPTEAWYFDTRFFDEEKRGRQKMPLNKLKLRA